MAGTAPLPDIDWARRVERFAEAIAQPGRGSVALVPASDGIRTELLSAELGAGLVRRRRGRVAVVFGDPAAAAELSRRIDGHARDAGEGVELAAPRELPPPGGMCRALAQLLTQVRSRCAFVIVDASAAQSDMERLAVSRLVDAVCVVARSGVTTEAELLSLARDIGRGDSAGVLICP